MFFKLDNLHYQYSFDKSAWGRKSFQKLHPTSSYQECKHAFCLICTQVILKSKIVKILELMNHIKTYHADNWTAIVIFCYSRRTS